MAALAAVAATTGRWPAGGCEPVARALGPQVGPDLVRADGRHAARLGEGRRDARLPPSARPAATARDEQDRGEDRDTAEEGDRQLVGPQVEPRAGGRGEQRRERDDEDHRLAVAVPQAHEVLLSGRSARSARVRDELDHRLRGVVDGVSVHTLQGFAAESSQAAQGAALIADGLSGGAARTLVDRMDIRGASGTVLDHLFLVSRRDARARLGLA